MLAPGSSLSSGRVRVTAGAGTTPNFFNGGMPFMADGSLAIDTNAPAGNSYVAGFRRNAQGALYGTTTTTGSDVYEGGLRRSTAGVLVYALAAATQVSNGNPLSATGVLAVI